jgi:hypothetical protein
LKYESLASFSIRDVATGVLMQLVLEQYNQILELKKSAVKLRVQQELF